MLLEVVAGVYGIDALVSSLEVSPFKYDVSGCDTDAREKVVLSMIIAALE